MLSLGISSCGKMRSGCTDSEAENYDVNAKLDCGCCMYHQSTTVTSTSGDWVFNDPAYQLGITWASLTQEVIDRGSYSVFVREPGSSSWLELPFTFTTSASYSSHFETSAQAGLVTVSRYDTDLIAPANPGIYEFKVSAWW